ncbi:MAG: flagellar FliJ family protein [Terricaulis sp.]
MRALRTLLKLAKRDLEALRRALAEKTSALALLEERILGHEQTLRAEQQAALRDYESARAYSGFAVLAAQGRRALESEREVIGQDIERLRTLIAEAHVEMRKFERLIELEETRARAALEKREDAELDEMATLRAGRLSRR